MWEGEGEEASTCPWCGWGGGADRCNYNYGCRNVLCITTQQLSNKKPSSCNVEEKNVQTKDPVWNMTGNNKTSSSVTSRRDIEPACVHCAHPWLAPSGSRASLLCVCQNFNWNTEKLVFSPDNSSCYHKLFNDILGCRHCRRGLKCEHTGEALVGGGGVETRSPLSKP